MKFRTTKLLQIAAMGMLSLAAVPSAEAVATLRISTNGVDWTTVTDTDHDGVVGTVFSSGVWAVTVSVGITKPLDGSITSPEMHLSVVAASVDLLGNGGSLYVQFSDDFFGPSAGFFNAGFAGNLATGASATYGTLMDGGNALFGGSALTDSMSGGPGVSSSVAGSSGIAANGQYSLTQTLVLTHGGGAQVSSVDLNLRLPEGGFSLTLLGGAMVGMALLRKRLFK